jgi:hypothetical protein
VERAVERAVERGTIGGIDRTFIESCSGCFCMEFCRPIRLIGIVVLFIGLLTCIAGCTGKFPAQQASPGTGALQDPGSACDPGAAAPRIPVPVDTSIPIQDPMPGVRYSLNASDSNQTIVLNTGDIVEVTLQFAPGLAMRWTVPVSGCGLELVNDGVYSTGGDFWNVTGYYRARYRAVSPGTSILEGKLVISPAEDPAGAPRFNLTVIVK